MQARPYKADDDDPPDFEVTPSDLKIFGLGKIGKIKFWVKYNRIARIRVAMAAKFSNIVLSLWLCEWF